MIRMAIMEVMVFAIELSGEERDTESFNEGSIVLHAADRGSDREGEGGHEGDHDFSDEHEVVFSRNSEWSCKYNIEGMLILREFRQRYQKIDDEKEKRLDYWIL